MHQAIPSHQRHRQVGCMHRPVRAVSAESRASRSQICHEAKPCVLLGLAGRQLSSKTSRGPGHPGRTETARLEVYASQFGELDGGTGPRGQLHTGASDATCPQGSPRYDSASQRFGFSGADAVFGVEEMKPSRHRRAPRARRGHASRQGHGHRMNTSVELVAVGCTVCQAGFGVHTAGFASVAALTSAAPLLRRRP